MINDGTAMKSKGKSIKKAIAMGGKDRDFSLAKVVCNNYGKTEEQSKMLYNYYHLLVNSPYFNEYAYSFFVEGLTYKQLNTKYGKRNYNNYIAKAVKELFADLGDDPLFMVMYENPSDEKVMLLNNQITKLLKKLGLLNHVGIKGMFTIDLEKMAKVDLAYHQTIDDDIFKDVLGILKPYVKKYQDLTLSQLEPEHFGYVYYLISTPNSNLTAKDLKRKKLLEMSWALK